MYICNLRSCDVVIYSSHDTSVIINVRYDEDIIRNYIPKLKHVYFRYMLKHLSSSFDKDTVKCSDFNKKVLNDILIPIIIINSYYLFFNYIFHITYNLKETNIVVHKYINILF